jgi:valyl-tRNA synthetase
VEPRRQIGAIFESTGDANLLEESQQAISALAGIDPENMRIESGAVQPPEDAVPLVVGGINIYLPVEGLFDAEQERSRLNAQLEEARSQIARLEDLLDGPFAEKAPPEVVEAEKNRLHEWKESEANILLQLEQLN